MTPKPETTEQDETVVSPSGEMTAERYHKAKAEWDSMTDEQKLERLYNSTLTLDDEADEA